MKKINILSITIIATILVAGVWLILSNKSEEAFLPEKSESVQEKIKKEVILTIDYGEEPPKVLKTEFRDGMTAFDLLKKETEKLKIALKTQTYDFGVFIQAIGEKENSESGKYWLCYVNDQMPQVAADKQKLTPGDRVEFKFEKPPF